MKKIVILFTVLIILTLASCKDKSIKNDTVDVIKENTATNIETKKDKLDMKLIINDIEIPVTWEENESVYEINEEVSKNDITVSMSMYGGNEQVGSLGKRYTSNDINTTTHNGDIVLYNSDNIVLFYGSNTWFYTRLGQMNLSKEEVTDLLSNGDVRLTLTK